MLAVTGLKYGYSLQGSYIVSAIKFKDFSKTFKDHNIRIQEPLLSNLFQTSTFISTNTRIQIRLMKSKLRQIR